MNLCEGDRVLVPVADGPPRRGVIEAVEEGLYRVRFPSGRTTRLTEQEVKVLR
jgi:hypothetical protein